METDKSFRPLAELFGMKELLINVMEQLDECEVLLDSCKEGSVLYNFYSAKRDLLKSVRDVLCEEGGDK